MAFEAIFGTSDMKKLLEIERDPVAYWNEREEALKGKPLPHLAFCKKYTKEARDYIRTKTAKMKKRDKPWFCQDPNAIKNALKSKISKDSPAYPTALAFYTALACDYLEKPWDSSLQSFKTQKKFLEDIDTVFLESEGLSDELNARMCWLIGGLSIFPIFDYLVLFSKKQYLCGATAYSKRMDFVAHRRPFKHPIFSGFGGPIPHDCLSHALRQHLVEYHLSLYGISYQDYFDQCWSKEKLIKNNIIGLAQCALGCFTHFHEAPSVMGSWKSDDVSSLIFPRTNELTDLGFLAIVPYFSEHATHHDWHTSPIVPPVFLDHHNTLCHFAETYCGPAGRTILEKYSRSITAGTPLKP